MGRPRKNQSSVFVSTAKKPVLLSGAMEVIASNDVLWDVLLKKLARQTRLYGFSRVETPLVESKILYEAFLTDHSLSDSKLVHVEGNSNAVLRPSLLPSLLRAYFENKIFDQISACKWNVSGMTLSMQEDKLQSDYEFGYEIFGNFTHLAEAQVISLIWDFLRSVGLEDLVLEINNIGNLECQKSYSHTLHNFLSPRKYELCDACNDHMKERILNVFRCENLDCQSIFAEAPTILDFLDADSHKHFTNILEALEEMGIPYQLNSAYIGPIGHAKINFAIKYKNKTGFVIIGEGGHHEEIIQQLSGKSYCCFGFFGSLKQVYDILKTLKLDIQKENHSEVYLVPLGELAAKKSLRLFGDLVRSKVLVYDHFGQGGVKNQLKIAEVNKAPIALIMGQKEAMDEMVILRDVKSGMQEIISYDKIIEEVKKRLGK